MWLEKGDSCGFFWTSLLVPQLIFKELLLYVAQLIAAADTPAVVLSRGIMTEGKSERLVPTFLLRTPEWHTQHSSLISPGEHLHDSIKAHGKVVAMSSAQTFSERTGERLVRSN